MFLRSQVPGLGWWPKKDWVFVCFLGTSQHFIGFLRRWIGFFGFSIGFVKVWSHCVTPLNVLFGFWEDGQCFGGSTYGLQWCLAVVRQKLECGSCSEGFACTDLLRKVLFSSWNWCAFSFTTNPLTEAWLSVEAGEALFRKSEKRSLIAHPWRGAWLLKVPACQHKF